LSAKLSDHGGLSDWESKRLTPAQFYGGWSMFNPLKTRQAFHQNPMILTACWQMGRPMG